MKSNMKLAVLPILLALQSTSAHARTDESILFDVGAHPAEAKAQQLLQDRQNRNRLALRQGAPELLSPFATAAGIQKVIDVAVFLHESYIDALKEPISKRDDGAFIENGAQYALARAESHIEHVNAALVKNNIDLKLNILYIGTTDVPVVSGVNRPVDVDTDHGQLINCAMFRELYEPEGRCEGFNVDKEEEIVNHGADVIYFIRPKLEGESIGGWGSLGLGATAYDNYVPTMKHVIANELNYSIDDIKDVQYGLYSAQIALHEFGHVFGGLHNASAEEPRADGAFNHDHACGNQLDPLEPRAVSGDLSTMRKTALWFATGRVGNQNHGFYSDPSVEVDGFKCGVDGEADNASFFRLNAGQYADNATQQTNTSEVSFSINSITAVRADKDIEVKLVRSGDLSKPAVVSVTARDGTAWEGRDFEVGLQEVRFAENEAEKTITVTLLERSDKHLDTAFELEARYAVGATIKSGIVDITIDSTNEPTYGSIATRNATLSVSEAIGVVNLSVVRTDGSDGEISFTLTTADSTAKAGTDYTALNRTVSMPTGVTTLDIPVQIVNRSGNQESRAFTIHVSGVTGGAVLGAQTQTTVTITNVEETPPGGGTGGGSGGGSGGNSGGGESTGGSGGPMGLWFIFSLLLLSSRRFIKS